MEDASIPVKYYNRPSTVAKYNTRRKITTQLSNPEDKGYTHQLSNDWKRDWRPFCFNHWDNGLQPQLDPYYSECRKSTRVIEKQNKTDWNRFVHLMNRMVIKDN